MTRLLSTTFRSLKPHSPLPKSPPNSKSSSSVESNNPNWSVYLILSTNPPIKTYVGVTTNFPRRLKQHNGELKGGAKASQAGRPWICACVIHGFEGKSEACKFEFRWKNISRKMARKKDSDMEGGGLHLLQHRNAALNKVKASDMFIIPSIFEPCGLTQMIAMRYGAIPIARKTGGLNDSDFDIDDDTITVQLRNGFTFVTPDEQGFNGAFDRAFYHYTSYREGWRQLMHKVMNIGFSWDTSASQYEELYLQSVARAKAARCAAG